MSTYYHTPENALKRANEFCELGKEDDALECLYNSLKNYKSRVLKSVHEIIINKLLELCVEKKNSQKAKDALFNYRSLCQGINIKSWEDSISKYLQLAGSKVTNAQETFQSLILDMKNLDQNVTPEMLLKSVSTEDNQNRTARIVLSPWIKFLWECYRNCLDLLKNVRSVKLYHTVAKNAFNFCVEFCRKGELRKLCNALKLHSIYIQNKCIKDDEMQLICLDTGFIELESTIKMEMWQDAFKAVNNIHALMNVSKNLQQSKIMTHYYNDISQIFWKGGEYLYHAAANLCYFSALRDQKKNLNSNEITKLSTQLILSILAVPPTSTNLKIDHIVETDEKSILRKNKLFSSLLHLSNTPTRASLIKEVVQLNILQYFPEEILNLFQTLEGKSDKIFPSILMPINFIKTSSDKELHKYIPLIQKVFITMLLTLLPNFYTNINMTKLLTLTGITQMTEFEVMLVESARRYELPIRIDHRNMQILFSTDFNIFKEEKKCDELALEYSLSDDHLRWLIDVHYTFKHAVKQIDPESKKNEHKSAAENIVHYYFEENESYRKSLLQRKTVIEKYKEFLEKSKLKKEEEKKKSMAEKLLKYETAEKERLLRETEERKLQRFRQEQEEIKRKILLERMETFKKSILGSKIVESLELENIDSLDPQIFFSKQVEQLNKERKQLDLRLRRQERNLDHFERAKRIEEMPLLIEQYEKEREIDIKEWNKAEINKIDAAHTKREQELRKKKRVLEIKVELNNFLEIVKKRNLEAYREEREQFLNMLTEEKQKKLKERAEKRKQKRREEWVKQQKLKIHDKTELKRQNVSKNKSDAKKNIAQKIVKNQNIKYVASPIKPMSTTVEDKRSISENKSSFKHEIYSVKYKINKHNYLTKISEDDLTTNTYYYKKAYKNDVIEVEQTEVHKREVTLFSESSNYLHAKSKQSQKSDIYAANENKTRTKIFKNSQQALLTWRTPWSRNESYQYTRYNKESEIPQQNITIMRRENRSEASNLLADSKNSDFQQEFFSRSENEGSNIKYSCTPWAKLQRQEHKK